MFTANRVCYRTVGKIKKSGVSVYIDTCGFVSQRALERILPYTDKFLYDIKAIDEEIHKKCTGQSNKAILENFRFLVEKSAPVEVRYPLIKGYNDGEAEKIGKFIAKLGCLTAKRLKKRG